MFRTPIAPFNSRFKINHQNSLLAIGSCFSETIGSRLKNNKFDIAINPYGTLFNPLSIFNVLEMGLTESMLPEHTIVKQNDVFLSHSLHSSIKAESVKALQEQVQQTNASVSARLKTADVLILTLGSAWVYEMKTTDQLVANCHKVPQKQFNKRLLNIEEVVAAFFDIKEQIEAVNPKIQFVFTVSPVRHTKDTLPLNTVSKSTLRLICHYLEEMTENVSYYPSFEIMMEDLRDYRFFEKDMIHPNEQAIDYIWEHFGNAFFTKQTQTLIKKWAKLQQALSHKPFNPESASHQKFVQKTIQKLEAISGNLPVSKEIEQLKQQLI
ncbi:GSCFA family protein [Roseivirga pacifica]|uniref:GSCFA family protein n=1 Tax=Roseivirga pacifica TaxID=1267423 RepID=A0A1I0QXY7_9BACT|nr:GSCFA domain-containing protein [Roseivirga pacifica]RKQ42399.1 GSCFA family protein [Roseivirga pacifica]SEW32446.1 GSCFA family protein [Roseivirga pacifica]